MAEFAVKWIYKLDKDYTYDLRSYLPANWNQAYAFMDSKGKTRLTINTHGVATVMAGYSWDGCTPKFSIYDIIVGIPDGVPIPKTSIPKAYYASLLHDVLYQFKETDMPLSRLQIDHVFLDILERDKFAPRKLYFVAVRMFGGGFHWLTRWKRRYAGKRVTLPIHSGQIIQTPK